MARAYEVVCASLADQAGVAAAAEPTALAIGLGANLPSPVGEPLATLLAVRPRLEQLLCRWAGSSSALHWSPLHTTTPLGGPADQPDYLNAVVVLETLATPSPEPVLDLLHQLQGLERAFGRQRLVHWGPRSLDLDLLWWGDLQVDGPTLQLPHPYWQERAFVLAPLRAIERRRGQALARPAGVAPFEELLAATHEPPPLSWLPSPAGWPH